MEMRFPALLALLILMAGCKSSRRSAPVMPETSGAADTTAVGRAASEAASQIPAALASQGMPENGSGRLATYMDAKTGVSFQYPDVWKAAGASLSYLGGEVPRSVFGEPRAAYAFSPEGNVYAKTLLTGLSFSYFAKEAPGGATCVQAVKKSGFATSTQQVSGGGVTFTEISGGDAGMCHEQAAQVDVTYAAGQCLVFDRDFNTECLGAGDGKRKLTDVEQRALQRHLNAVMESVRVRP